MSLVTVLAVSLVRVTLFVVGISESEAPGGTTVTTGPETVQSGLTSSTAASKKGFTH